jgi:hypothetical protein
MIASSGKAIMPNQDVENYTDDNYIETLRWIAWQYNLSYNNIPLVQNGNLIANANINYINEYVDNLTYIYGMQVPADYKFFTMDANGNDLQTPLVRGLDVYKIYNYLFGEATDIIDPLPKTLNVTAYSKDAISAKKDMMDYIKFQIENKAFLNILQQQAGYEFKAINKDFENNEQVDKFFTTFQESMEIGYEQIARHVAYNNDYKQKLSKAFSYALIGNLGTLQIEYINGEIVWEVVPCEENITDYTKGLDVHKEDDFGGRIRQMTIPALLEKYDFTKDERKELESIADSNSSFGRLYSGTYAANNVFWITNNNGVPKVTVVSGQWISLEKGEDGKIRECLREGDLIANKYLRGQKISNGQVWQKGKRSKKRLKYITMTPNLFMGTSISVVGIIKRFANLKDAFITKMVEMASSSIGKATVVRASKLPEGLRAPDVIAQLKQARVLVIEGEETEEAPNGARLAETVDLTLDPNIQLILGIVQYLDQAINDYLNIPQSVRGMSATYQSAKGIESTQNQSSKGLSYLFKTLQNWMAECLSYSADLMKLMAPDDELGREQLSLIVGDAMVELLSMDTIRNAQFEDFLLHLNPSDYNSISEKEQLNNLLLQTATSGMPLQILKTYLAVKSSESLTEAENKIDAMIYKQEKMEAEKAAAEREMAMMQSQQASETQQYQADVAANAGLEKAAMDNETKQLSLFSKMQEGGKPKK